MIKTNQHHLELFHLATKLDKNKNFDLSDHIYELMTRLSQIDNPPIDLSLGGPDAANNPKNAVDYFIGVAYDAIVNKKKDKESALKAMDHYRKRQNKEVLEPEEQIQTDSDFWQNVNSVLETKDWWQKASESTKEEVVDSKSPKDFFESLSGPAKIASEQSDGIVPPSLILSLAAQESAYGKSKLAKEHNNFYGIKFPGSGANDKITYKTYEYDDSGNKYQTDADFASYKTDIVGGMSALPNFLMRNKRYKKGLELGKIYKNSKSLSDLENMINEIFINAGYSTDKNEPDELMNIIQKYNLQKYD
jgi:flagellum-specific peptidoglycan hydrolase FlgJ